ncbi:alpha/beta-hydrolase [Serendipita vermifera]|nr:alpha/beta-hydrolase [Serendipita vermifera]
MSTSTSAASSLPTAPEIPDGFFASLKSWLASGHKEAEIAEERLLRRLSTFRSKDEHDVTTPSTANARISQVPLSNGKSRYINMLSILPTTPAYPLPASKGPATSTSAAAAPSSFTNDNSRQDTSEAPPTTVILHGYGAGLGFFSLNLEALSSWVSKRGLPVYLLDWLGMGRSARPTFKVSAKPEDTPARVQQAESFFLDALEEWRGTMGINRMTLVGHSLGAYLVTAYALKYPQHVSRLVLLSPAGVPAGPNTTVPAAELTRSRTHPEGSEVTQPPRELKNPNSKDVSGIKQEQVREIEEQKEEKQKEPWTRRLFVHLWEAGYSPFGVLRLGGPWAPLLVAKYTTRRFADLDPEHVRDLHQYLLQISLARGSGEYALSHILAPMAYARMPLEYRVANLSKDIPVTFVYGSHDWMDPEGGVRSVKKLKQVGNIGSKMYTVPGAGHHVYLDNPGAVNKLLVKELDLATARNSKITLSMQ